MARPTGTKLPDIATAHDAIVRAYDELRTSMLQNPPSDAITAERYQSIIQQFRIIDKVFSGSEEELKLFFSPDPKVAARSRFANMREVLLLASECRNNIALWANIVQRKKEIEATMSRTEILQRIADKVED